MSNELDAFNNYDPAEIKTTTRQSKITFEVPGPDKPLVFKIVPDPRFMGGKMLFRPVVLYPYSVGPTNKDKRFRTCLSFFGETAPEKEVYDTAKKNLDVLNKSGQGNSDEAKKLAATVALFKPTFAYYVLYIEPNSPDIKAIKLKKSAIECVTGREANQYQPALPDLRKQMAADGVLPNDLFNPKSNSKGWLKLWKEGVELATRYHIVPLKDKTSTVIDGKTYYMDDYIELPVHERIAKKQFQIEDFPNVLEFEEKSRWTLNEVERFIESSGTEVPERFYKKQKPDGQNAANNPEVALANLQASAVLESIDDIPL
jgi:hypothetical protein